MKLISELSELTITMPGGKCRFQISWLEKFSWLREYEKDTSKVTCTVCKADFDISNGGITAINRHAKGKKHSDLATAL